MSEATSRLRRLLPWAPILVLVGLFVGHRVLVALGAGDIVYPIEPSEAKNTQITWDLATGRFGEDGYTLRSYVANSGSVHHASYSTTALAYWVSNKLFGFTLLSIRMTPLLFWIGALLLWAATLKRWAGATAAALAVTGLFLVPTLLIAFQLTFLGCHSESVLPLAAVAGAWALWTESGGRDPRRAALFGACFGYCAIFSYLTWPILGILGAASLVPPAVRPGLRAARALLGGVVAGLWPLWLILVLDPFALTVSITEQPETTLLNTAAGLGITWGEYTQTVAQNLPYGANDYWNNQAEAGRLWFGQNFEWFAYRLMVFGPLLLIPWAALERNPTLRRLALAVAVIPATSYLWLAFASPWRPHIPVRYLMPLSLFALSAPGLAVGLALRRLRAESEGRPNPTLARAAAVPLLLAAAGSLLWLAPPRLHEARAAVRLDRAEALREHRYLHYYNLGIGNVWPEQVAAVNDLIDVRNAAGDPRAFDGVQAGLWGSGGMRLGLGLGMWEPQDYGWPSMQGGVAEWSERRQHKPDAERGDPETIGENIGWGTAILTAGDVGATAGIVREAKEFADDVRHRGPDESRGMWPEDVPWEAFWRGYGMGWGRADPEAPTDPTALPFVLTPREAAAVVEGVKKGRALGDVPKSGMPPAFLSVRGTAT